MIGEVQNWFLQRSRREQWLLLIMAAIALPILTWLLVVRPLTAAYEEALQAHLEAVDRHGRVAALSSGAPQARRTANIQGDLQQFVTESAGRGGVTLVRVEPAGAGELNLSASAPTTAVLLRWLNELEQQGIVLQQGTMTPAPAGSSISLSAQLIRR